MDIKKNIVERLNSVYNFVITKEIFDNITFLGIGKRIQLARKDKQLADMIESNNQLLDSLVNDYQIPSQQAIARMILKNQLEHISRESGLKHPSNPAHNQIWMMSIAAKVVKQILALNGIVGIQPLSGPAGLVYSMTYTVTDEHQDEAEKEDQSSTEIFNVSSTRKISLEIISAAVQVVSRKLQAGWTMEVAQDLLACHDLNFEQELISAISHEVGTEIIWEVINDLVKLAEKNPTSQRIDIAQHESEKLPSCSDYIQRLLIGINQNAYGIAKSTRRGVGNKIITTPLGLCLLQSQKHIRFVSATTKKDSVEMGTFLYAGYLSGSKNSDGEDNKSFDVYVTLAPALSEGPDTEVKFLIGYKGGTSECDTGYIYSPYVPIMASGTIIDNLTFQPIMTLMTRYAKWIKESVIESELEKTESVGKASDYYNLLTFEIDLNKTI